MNDQQIDTQTGTQTGHQATVIDTAPVLTNGPSLTGGSADVVIEDEAPDYGVATDTDAVNEDTDEIAALPKGAEELADGSVEVTLDRPVTLTLVSQSRGTKRQETVVKVRFHRLTGAHLTEITSAADKVREKVAFALAARMNKAKMNALFDRMDAADIGRCGQVLEYFLGSGRKTGRT